MRRILGVIVAVALWAPAGAAGDTTEAPPAPAAKAPANVRLRSLEQRVQALKEKVSAVERNAEILRGKVLGRAGVTTIRHANRMGRSFRLLEVGYVLDGRRVFARKDKGGDLDVAELEVLAARLQPGAHTLAVTLRYRGHGYGVFDYFNRYRFTIRDSYTFTVSDRGQTEITVEGYEKGDRTTPMQDRPASRLIVKE